MFTVLVANWRSRILLVPVGILASLSAGHTTSSCLRQKEHNYATKSLEWEAKGNEAVRLHTIMLLVGIQSTSHSAAVSFSTPTPTYYSKPITKKNVRFGRHHTTHTAVLLYLPMVEFDYCRPRLGAAVEYRVACEPLRVATFLVGTRTDSSE